MARLFCAYYGHMISEKKKKSDPPICQFAHVGEDGKKSWEGSYFVVLKGGHEHEE